MVISEYLNCDGLKCSPRRFLIKCDDCGTEYNRSHKLQKEKFKIYGRDLCRSCNQKEQYKLEIRSKNQCYKAAIGG